MSAFTVEIRENSCKQATLKTVGAVFSAWVLLLGGCGGGTSATPRRQVAAPPGIDLPSTNPTSPSASSQATPDVGASRPVEPPATPADENATAPNQRGVAGTPGAQGTSSGEPTGAKPARPEQIADWKPTDYLSAKLDRDPRLAEAVVFLGEKYASSANAARTLVKLLVVDPTTQPSQSPEGESGAGAASGDKESEEGRFPPQPGRTPYGALTPQQPDHQLATACMDALVKNTTPPAHEALGELLKGKRSTPLSRDETTRELLRALGTYLRSDHDTILFDLITNPQAYVQQSVESAAAATSEASAEGRFSEQGSQLTADWFQSEAIRAAGARASEELRARLAKFLDDPNVPQETAGPLEAYLATENHKNLRAQIILYRNEHTADQVRSDLENRLVAASGAALAELLGVPADQQGGLAGGGESSSVGRFASSVERLTEPRGRPSAEAAVRPSRPSRQAIEGESARPSRLAADKSDGPATVEEIQEEIDPKTRHYDVARALWTPETASLLESTLGSTEWANSGSSKSLLFAGTVPLDATRRLMHGLLVDRREDGPQIWSSSGLLGSEVCDPALLVLVKDAYHSTGKDSKRRASRSRSDAASQGGSRGKSEGSQSSEGRFADRSEGGASGGGDEAWSAEVEQLVASLCERCFAAAQQTPGDDRAAVTADTSEEGGDPGVRLHKDASMVAELQVRWPEQLPKELAGTPIAGLWLHYLRVEDEQRVKPLLTHYRRQARNAKEHENGDVRWFDRLEKNATEGTQKSIDIRITGADENEQSSEPVPVVVEILTIRIPIPGTAQEPEAKGE